MKRWAIATALLCAAALVVYLAFRPTELADPEGTLGPLISGELRQAESQPDIYAEADDLSTRSPLVLIDQVSLEDVLTAATAGTSAEDAEDFAIKAMIYLGDDQNGPVGPREIATLVAAGQKKTAEYIYNQMGIPERLGFEPARIDQSLQPWVRTDVVMPDRVRTALTMYVLYPGFFEESDGTWVRYVTESVYVNGVWQLSSWNNYAGSGARQPTEDELRIYFDDGVGWRRATFE